MSPSPPTHIRIPPLNPHTDSVLDEGAPSPGSPPLEYVPPRLQSHDNMTRRVSFSRPHPPPRRSSGIPLTRTISTTGGRSVRDTEAFLSPVSERPPIPSALAGGGARGVYATPLPKIPLAVLSITMLGEFLSANVCTPFLLFMVEGFMAGDEKADVGYWTGILVSTFFLTQFLTSLLWATVADRHGKRAVLFVSLLGSALTCFAFGTSTSLPEALAIRLLQGIFAGSIGVARSSVATITDGSNEGRAYAILGFSWGLGGVAGAIIGGTFESPVKKWPGLFANVSLFIRFPYLLPCAIAASVMFTGAVLSLFLARDGGSREGNIQLPIGKETEPGAPDSPVPADLSSDEEPSSSDTIAQQLHKAVSKRFSRIFSEGGTDAQMPSTPLNDHVPLSSPITIPRRLNRIASSRPSRANGSAYGYGGIRNRLPSAAESLRRRSMASSLRPRRGTYSDPGMADTLGTSRAEGSNFAQRLLMANEMAVSNIADLWVAAAITVDTEDVFMSDEDDRDFSDDELDVGETPRLGRGLNQTITTSSAASRNPLEIHRTFTTDSAVSHNALEFRRTLTAESTGPRNPLEINRTFTADSAASRTFYPGRHESPDLFFSSTTHSPSPARGRNVSSHQMTPTRARLAAVSPVVRESFADGSGTNAQLRHRGSRAFSIASSQIPSIYANAGVRAPPGFLAEPLMSHQTSGGEDPYSDGLDTIPERQRLQQPRTEEEKPQSLFKQLPLMIILQYGLLALHSTTHDQLFLTYLVSPYESSGLGLNAGNFAQLIALMCLAQIAYQFYLYPNIGPPRGRFSHLAMFRLGSLLFIPAYASVTIYRVFASADDDGNFLLMTLLAISTAIRYCGATFSYTSVAILLNYMSPPHVIGLANGLAQSIVSLARFAGPVLGGFLWSVSVQDNPKGYPLGFFICSGVCAVAILHSFVIR